CSGRDHACAGKRARAEEDSCELDQPGNGGDRGSACGRLYRKRLREECCRADPAWPYWTASGYCDCCDISGFGRFGVVDRRAAEGWWWIAVNRSFRDREPEV